MLYFANKGVQKVYASNPALADKINKQGCCLTETDLAEVVKIDRMMLVLVRCGCGRFLAPAQDVQHFINIIEEHKGDHVRDVSFPAG